MRRLVVLSLLIAGGLLSLTVAAFQQPPAPMVVEADKIKDNLYVLKGGGGNTSVFITAAGVVVVDTKNPGWGAPLLAKIKTITDKPVTTIINTHTHGDHVSGNVEFPATVDIIVQENTKTNMMAMRPAAGVAQPAGGPPPNIFTANGGKGMPKRTFKDKLTLGKGADEVDLYYFGRAHTNGDAVVLFPALRVMHIADMFPTRGLPIMDSNNGGTGVGYADTLAKAAAFADKNADILVNGHNDKTTTPADLHQFHDFVADFVKAVQDGKKAGMTAEQTAAAWKTPAKYAGYETMPIATRVLADAQLIFSETK
jgi:glyoxylase-like metal-dependent hydrolase (beta-lactamase superfamily II)